VTGKGRPPGSDSRGPEDTRRPSGESAAMVTDLADVVWLRSIVGPPSSFGLTHAQLAAHVRELRREGWMSWEIRARFDFGACA